MDRNSEFVFINFIGENEDNVLYSPLSHIGLLSYYEFFEQSSVKNLSDVIIRDHSS